MLRLYRGLAWSLLFAVALATSCSALTLISPTEGQIVRENVKIQMPASAVSDDRARPGFISIYVGEPKAQKFIAAMSRTSAKEAGGVLTFYWNSKAAYHEPGQAGKPQYLKDGVYPLLVRVHDDQGRVTDSATVQVNLRNKVARTSPAPGVSLVNRLSFGQTNTFRAHAQIDMYQTVANVDLPILGGLGVTSDFRIEQSVEDVRSNGELMMRYQIAEGAFISVMGNKTLLYEDQRIQPQLYSLVNRRGEVMTGNLFKKQAKYSIMGILPVLPSRPVKEGDTWPDSLRVKIEGLTDLANLQGTASLDSFEWQDGRECAKIISRLTGTILLSLAGGKIVTSGPANAEVTTYFAHKTGTLIKREMLIDVPVTIAADAGSALEQAGTSGEPVEASAMVTPPSMMPSAPYGEGEDDGESARPTRPPRGYGAPSGATRDTGAKKGKARINLVLRLER